MLVMQVKESYTCLVMVYNYLKIDVMLYFITLKLKSL